MRRGLHTEDRANSDELERSELLAHDDRMSQATLHTARLRLVPLAEEHLESEVELDADPEVMRYLAPRASSRETTERAHRKRLGHARRAPGMGYWAGLTAADEFVGYWLLRPREDTPVEGEAELGYRLMRRFWRQGLATAGARELLRYGFADLGLHRIVAETMATNTGSRAVMATLGFRYVRAFHRRRDEPWPGTELEDVEYAITRDAWLRPPLT